METKTDKADPTMTRGFRDGEYNEERCDNYFRVRGYPAPRFFPCGETLDYKPMTIRLLGGTFIIDRFYGAARPTYQSNL